MLIIFVLGRMGAYTRTMFYYDHRTGYTDGGHAHPIHFEFNKDLHSWILECWRLIVVAPFDTERLVSPFDAHLWTIPTEFRGSLALFAVQWATARLGSVWRMLVVVALVWVCGIRGRWELMLFLGGSFLAEANMLLQERFSRVRPPQLPVDATHRKQGRGYARKSLQLFLLILSLYLLSSPGDQAPITPGYKALGSVFHLFSPSLSHEAKTRFWQIPGAALLVVIVGNADYLRKFFSTPLFSYLGKISFALYLVHGMVNHLVGFAVMWHIFTITGRKTAVQTCVGFMLGAAINSIVVFWAADLFHRVCELPTVKLGKWIEDTMIKKGG